MSAKDLIFDPATIDLNTVVADIEDIRKYNRQRFEMEQLTAIVHQDPDDHTCIGYKDVTADEFWVRGHMPNMPLMPGVIICEAAAQMCSYYVQKYDLMGCEVVGFGGLEDVRFRGVVRPCDRLVIVAKLIKVRRGRMIVCRFQAFVGESMVCEGIIRGIPLPVEMLTSPEQAE